MLSNRNGAKGQGGKGLPKYHITPCEEGLYEPNGVCQRQLSGFLENFEGEIVLEVLDRETDYVYLAQEIAKSAALMWHWFDTMGACLEASVNKEIEAINAGQGIFKPGEVTADNFKNTSSLVLTVYSTAADGEVNIAIDGLVYSDDDRDLFWMDNFIIHIPNDAFFGDKEVLADFAKNYMLEKCDNLVNGKRELVKQVLMNLAFIQHLVNLTVKEVGDNSIDFVQFTYSNSRKGSNRVAYKGIPTTYNEFNLNRGILYIVGSK